MLRRSQKAFAQTFVRATRSSSSGSSTSALAYKTLHRNQKRPPLPTVETLNWSADTAVSSILYETPVASRAPPKQHVLNCLVQNEPGVLSSVSGTLAARGFNIDSLVVCNTEVKDLSRMTIVLKGQDGVVEQARRQIEDLVPVYAVLDYTNAEIIKRELLLARVSILGPEYFQELIATHQLHVDDASAIPDLSACESAFHPSNLAPSEALRQKHEHLDHISTLTKQFGGKIVDVSDRNVIVELSAKPSRISAFITLLQPFGIIELARSGMMALPRTPLESLSEEDDLPVDAADIVDASQLPPG
ncbi:acetolactate synthase, regulatory subunit [Lodderomyces elongisporus]|uniref:Acetolactate synthase small subunit, mitochondrial n=1 Tax=Lodderomyces elongisporus (strain ATCC 11503 / CBS 2605 / JCM 1781 / NBRC 1676 / NRRL YB-4239) TaxID=379508 RepID=A5E3P3_LODEL|nr:acetolactate synthase, regulatory subunit [Lodderomyces elongisporus]EDK46051.1 acetolactate synthase small subunit, mitochondrial precursor [Lodderomyces elongisporus NRRL YB-4239]WLF80182.1 acetolactate synthase, regulatory subunit [Lodderomyces elongisporus]